MREGICGRVFSDIGVCLRDISKRDSQFEEFLVAETSS